MFSAYRLGICVVCLDGFLQNTWMCNVGENPISGTMLYRKDKLWMTINDK